MDKSGNPALKQSVLQRISALEASDTATVGGTVTKIIILLIVLTIGALSGWRLAANASDSAGIILLGSMFGGTALAFLTIFVPKVAPYTSPIYALLEGILLGAISQVFNVAYGGIVMQAVLLTFGVLLSTLVLYTTGVVKVTAKLRAVIVIATLAIALYYVTALIFSLFGSSVPLIYDSGTGGIIFSAIVVLIAALNLLLDFDFIERTAKSGAPKVFEWYGAFSLMITLVWLYLEILRLLGKSRS